MLCLTTNLFYHQKWGRTQMIDASRQNVAIAVNSEITLLYWKIGKRINEEVLGNERAEYGKQIVI